MNNVQVNKNPVVRVMLENKQTQLLKSNLFRLLVYRNNIKAALAALRIYLTDFMNVL